ncbi:hypothetical protein ACNJX9_31275 [Bradyrhizobium sp. DASA03076]|uniref:hypothetical protein n=1 Tax=Bradyrhizobium sp. BLXBL-03 TaxID=3395916 RepID=UPI003F703FFE
MKTPKPKQWAEQEVQRFIGLARQGASKIAAELGCHAGSVRRMARTLGLRLKKEPSECAGEGDDLDDTPHTMLRCEPKPSRVVRRSTAVAHP